jgi:probable F420-dependent oxidoreductase
MKFGITAVGSGATAHPDNLLLIARKAEELGFESVWCPEHLAVPLEMSSPYPYSADGRFPGPPTVALHDPLIALAFVAAATTRIKLGTGVYVLPLRNPLAVAKAVASLDVLSRGRVLFGIGIGWLREEFEAVGVPFADRAARTREWVAMLKALWTEEEPRFNGPIRR